MSNVLHLRIVMEASAVEIGELDCISRGKSSAIFLDLNSPTEERISRKHGLLQKTLTRFALSNYDPTAIQYRFQLVQVHITIGGARCTSRRNDGLFD